MLERQGNLPSHKTEVGRLRMEERPERKASGPLGAFPQVVLYGCDSNPVHVETVRPITAKLLNQLDLTALAKRLGKWNVEFARALNTVQWNSDMDRSKQTRLI